ncbi:MAG TPA: ROK family protein [Jatrophihabitans sp.]|jgi:glucokinase|uniref:ROK family protein n=1 Tax=Jatrophihabitans sp. TaxID=1932789 RepID=UPI002E0B912F|nr:ROK family protein [Jatrophihabitans sp.]
MSVVPVLEIGGTHVSAALVDPSDWSVPARVRLALEADADADAVIGRFAAAAAGIDAPPAARWGVAMPDPFDYQRGMGLFEGVGKFAALRGVDVGTALRRRMRSAPATLAFLNDADAFALGECVAGAARGARRCLGITLGTGIGSGWIVDGEIVDPGFPPDGRLHRLTIAGHPLEDVVSRRAIRRAFGAAGGDPGADVRGIAAAARAGDARARRVLDAAFVELGRVVGSCQSGFRPDVLVIGGSMAASWDVIGPAFRAGAEGSGLPEVRIATDSDTAPLIGAARHAVRGVC